MVAIDLNSDLGESFGAWSFGDDSAMLPIVTSANVACGFHAGDPTVLRTVCTQAVSHGVVIGAQVSYPDLVGFGRRFIDMTPDELRDAVLYQLGALDAFAQVAGAQVAYVKPHGALYHAVAGERALADAVVAAAVDYDPSLAILGLPGSELLAAADRGRAGGRRRGVRRSRVPARRRTRVTAGGGRGAHRSARRRRTGRPVRRRPRGRRRRWFDRARRRSLAVRARRHARSRGDRDRGARRPRRSGRGDRTLRGVTWPRRAAGPSAWLIDDVDDAAGWAGSLRAAAIAGVVEVVPAESTVLVVCDRARSGAIGPLLDAIVPAPLDRAARSTVTIEVVYDGADLADVAAATGLTDAEVIERHAAGVYTVAFCGFSPGFGYLRGLDSRPPRPAP